MRLLYNGIHKRLGFIVQHCGGYDRAYHMRKISNDLNIEYEYIDRLFEESSNSNISHYLALLEQGVHINKILTFIKIDNDIIRKDYYSEMIAFQALNDIHSTRYNY